MRLTMIALALSVPTVLGCSARRPAASPAPVSYTTAQAAEGARSYDLACAACHGNELGGSATGPALVGASFAERWHGHPAAALIERVREHMPRPLPGQLNDRAYAAVIAYLLARNGTPAGAAPLAIDAPGALLVGPPR
jgi:mono/diheme cytochrome c family protein